MRVRFVGYVVYVEGEFYRGEGGGGGCYGAVELLESSKEAGSLVALSVEFCLDDVELKTIVLAAVFRSQKRRRGTEITWWLYIMTRTAPYGFQDRSMSARLTFPRTFRSATERSNSSKRVGNTVRHSV
jgi:hypothetical protein